MWKFNFAKWIAATLVLCVESFASEFWKITHMGASNMYSESWKINKKTQNKAPKQCY